MAKAEQIESLDQKRKELEARRVRLRSEIRDVSSRARIAPIAEQRLHLRVANDSQVINLPRSSIPPAVRRDDPR
jgi:cell division protein FtsB